MKNIVVIGSSGAIGKAFVESYIKDTDVENIFSFSRSDLPIKDTKLHSFFIDIEDEESIANAASKIDKSSICLLYTSPSPRDKRQSRMPSSA